MRTPAVKFEIIEEYKRILSKRIEKQTKKQKQSGKYTIFLNGIKSHLHVMLDFQRTSTKCRIAFCLYNFGSFFLFRSLFNRV